MIIKRVSQGQFGTFGVIMHENVPFGVTLERSWANNQVNISCIPGGQYDCWRVDSPKFGDTFQLMNVPDRTHILFHKANLVSDLLGCIAIGEEFGHLYGTPGVLQSGKGYKEFMNILDGKNEFRLAIV